MHLIIDELDELLGDQMLLSFPNFCALGDQMNFFAFHLVVLPGTIAFDSFVFWTIFSVAFSSSVHM